MPRKNSHMETLVVMYNKTTISLQNKHGSYRYGAYIQRGETNTKQMSRDKAI